MNPYSIYNPDELKLLIKSSPRLERKCNPKELIVIMGEVDKMREAYNEQQLQFYKK